MKADPALFVKLCRAKNLPEPVPEFRFAPPRRWRFDYAWIGAAVALEVEGGLFVQGRHSRGAGMLKDMEKYNTAVVNGWRVMRCTPSTLCAPSTFALLGKLLHGCEGSPTD